MKANPALLASLARLPGVTLGPPAKIPPAAPPAEARPRPGRQPRTAAVDAHALRWAVEFSLACRVVSEQNQHEHWTHRSRRAKEQADALTAARHDLGWMHWRPLGPCLVTLTHLGPTMDDDNLNGAFKALRDAVARWLGRDDAPGSGIEWAYRQRRGKPGVELRIESVDPAEVVG